MTGRRTLLAAGLALAAAPAWAAPDDAPFRAVWEHFRAAVLRNDMAAVLRLCRLPVESRGELDDAPVRRLTASTFPAAFRRRLAAEEDADTGRSLLEVIRATPRPVLDSRNFSDRQASVGSLTFLRGREGWRLAVIHRNADDD